ncbi:hypothetical protein PISMIDRAFT_106003 [Pisolithus microcarpus 441]|uniref:Rad21/Rec8-like protein N-terminal domain-containing protein n=1 Tax=Pisolithus microcarpus 441 TaxID=765257 RepID=A0A0C9YUD2_9AGAM|nr:Rec8 like protein-domain-containing protein [Pisolithus microcarpus]KIK20341.1 hypothetical protein PISMIDRAFT_106003 [Pisolithus microcarpus 441]
MEQKLSKTQMLQTDIEQAAGAIMGQEVKVMALHLSGQLLLGVVHIYSRKAKYLLEDCNEALLKIKMVSYAGILPRCCELVDMTKEQLVVNRNTIGPSLFREVTWTWMCLFLISIGGFLLLASWCDYALSKKGH